MEVEEEEKGNEKLKKKENRLKIGRKDRKGRAEIQDKKTGR